MKGSKATTGPFGWWTRFWFTPADPTPLGVVRILCGLMLLYVHLAYCYDLMNFHGKEAWLDSAMIDELRKEAPIIGPNFSWETPIPYWSRFKARAKELWKLSDDDIVQIGGKEGLLRKLQEKYHRGREQSQREIEDFSRSCEIDGTIERKWDRLKPIAQQRWDLADEEMSRITGRKEELVRVLQEKNGWPTERAERQVEDLGRAYVDQFTKKWEMYPSQAVTFGHPIFSIWFHVTEPKWMWTCHAIMLSIMFLFTIGLGTRVTSVLTWLSILCYIQRAPTSLFGMDTIMNLLVFYLMIGPSGAALSIDRLLKRYWQRRQALRLGAPLPVYERPLPSVSANLSLRLLHVHISIVYFASGLSKLQGPAWWNDTAVWSTMADFEFSPMHYALYMSALYLLVEHRWLWELAMHGISRFTLVFEIGFLPLFALGEFFALVGPHDERLLSWRRRIRAVLIVSAVLLHLGIAIFMGLVCFSLMMLVAVCSLVPAETWHRLFDTFYQARPGIGVAPLEAKAA